MEQVSGEVEDKGVEMKHTFFVLGLMNVKENKMVKRELAAQQGQL